MAVSDCAANCILATKNTRTHDMDMNDPLQQMRSGMVMATCFNSVR
jgi:hypothetical protein